MAILVLVNAYGFVIAYYVAKECYCLSSGCIEVRQQSVRKNWMYEVLLVYFNFGNILVRFNFT